MGVYWKFYGRCGFLSESSNTLC